MYRNLKKYLQDGDEDELRRTFAVEKAGVPPLRSTRLPVGRLVIDLPMAVMSISGENYLDCSFESRPPEAGEIKGFFNSNNFPELEIFDSSDGSSGRAYRT